MFLIDKLPASINLGNQIENDTKIIQIDVSAWNALYPGCAYHITAMRPGDTGNWPVTGVSHADGVLTWVVPDTVTSVHGQGSLVIHCTLNGKNKNTGSCWYFIGPGHAAMGEAPDPVADWIREADAKLDEVDESIESANAAEGLREAAEEARETAEGLRAGSETSRNTAEGLRDSAETARKEAEVLRVAAEAARMGFKPMGAYNPANENKYGEWYTHEGGSYGYIWPEPSTGVPLSNTSHWQQIAEKGDKGDKGDTGTTAFESAQIGGYTGSLTDFYADLARLDNMPPETWVEFQSAVRNGTIDRYFAVGDQFNVLKGGANLVFDLVDIGSSARNIAANGNAPTDPNYFTNFPNAKPVTLLMHDFISGVVFDASEANYQITTGIPSGAKCNISLESNTIAAATYNFTAPSALVVGGRLRISNATTLQYYATPAAAAVNIAMVAGAADAEYISIAGSLSAQNNKHRVGLGSNKYTESAIRQWLNAGSPAGTFWVSKSIYDLAPSWNSTLVGFRNGLDPDLLAVLGETTREVELATIPDGGGHASFSDNIFLPSRMEIYGSAETAGHKGLQFQSYVGLPDIDRIKYDTRALNPIRNWWLRSPSVGNANYERIVEGSTGALVGGFVFNGNGAVAACVIL